MSRQKKGIRLSCLVTNYNQIEWIEEAIESILNQNMNFAYEILIGDDGSNDGSLELLEKKYGKTEQIRILVQDRDAGVKEFPDWRHSRLIFRLIDEARGEYLSILDGDDYFCSMDHFQKKIEILDRDENRDCAACYGNMYKLVDGNMEPYTCVPYQEGKYQWLKDSVYIHLAAGVFRRKAVKNVPRNIYYEEFEDWQITFWLAHQGLFYYDPAPCFVYRILSGSMWHGVSTELNALRSVIVCDLNYQAYGGRHIDAFRPRRNTVLALYDKKELPDDIDYEMWNPFTVKYHAKVAHMLLNRDSLKWMEKVWLSAFCLRLRAPWKILCQRALGYCIGIEQLCDPKISRAQKQMLIKKWWARITGKSEAR